MADDTTVFLTDPQSVKMLFKVLHSFGLTSGLKLNKLKTGAMWIGSNEEKKYMESCEIKFVNEVFSLGIWFSTNENNCIERNYAAKFDKFCRALNMWKYLWELSLKGKITIIKTLALPMLLYITSSLPIPADFVQKVNREAYKFIWNNKPEKVSRETLTADIEKGGLKMINLHMFKAQKVMWTKRLVSGEVANWKAYPLSCLAPLGKNFLKCSFHPKYLPMDLPIFYHQVLFAWGECQELCTPRHKNAWDIRREVPFLTKTY